MSYPSYIVYIKAGGTRCHGIEKPWCWPNYPGIFRPQHENGQNFIHFSVGVPGFCLDIILSLHEGFDVIVCCIHESMLKKEVPGVMRTPKNVALCIFYKNTHTHTRYWFSLFIETQITTKLSLMASHLWSNYIGVRYNLSTSTATKINLIETSVLWWLCS